MTNQNCVINLFKRLCYKVFFFFLYLIIKPNLNLFICFYYSLGPLEAFPREMVSRRKILSRSRDDLNLDQTFQQQEEEEDVWFNKDKLYKVRFFFSTF